MFILITPIICKKQIWQTQRLIYMNFNVFNISCKFCFILLCVWEIRSRDYNSRAKSKETSFLAVIAEIIIAKYRGLLCTIAPFMSALPSFQSARCNKNNKRNWHKRHMLDAARYVWHRFARAYTTDTARNNTCDFSSLYIENYLILCLCSSRYLTINNNE